MKKGQIILGAIALVVTAGSTLAFKVANKFSGRGVLHVHESSGVCGTCSTIATGIGLSTAAVRSSCVTINSGTTKYFGAGVNKHTFYTQSNCTSGKVTKVTINL